MLSPSVREPSPRLPPYRKRFSASREIARPQQNAARLPARGVPAYPAGTPRAPVPQVGREVASTPRTERSSRRARARLGLPPWPGLNPYDLFDGKVSLPAASHPLRRSHPRVSSMARHTDDTAPDARGNHDQPPPVKGKPSETERCDNGHPATEQVSSAFRSAPPTNSPPGAAWRTRRLPLPHADARRCRCAHARRRRQALQRGGFYERIKLHELFLDALGAP